MAKNAKQKGRSVRNGNAASPYRKYNKVPYKYSAEYQNWRQAKVAGREYVKPVKGATKVSQKYLEAAE